LTDLGLVFKYVSSARCQTLDPHIPHSTIHTQMVSLNSESDSTK